MTLLSICQDAADEGGINRPQSIVGSSSTDAQLLLRLAKKVGLMTMKKYPWQILRKEQTFTAISGETQTGILPADFDRFVAETFWDRSTPKLMVGPISAVEWQGLNAKSYTGPEKKFALRGNSVIVQPVFGGGESLAFEYVSKNWCQSSGGTAQATWAADTDMGILSEELITLGVIFEYLDGAGQPAGTALGKFTDYWNVLVQNDEPTARIMSAGDIFGPGRHFTGTPHLDG
jgi:hypothetical protein